MNTPIKTSDALHEVRYEIRGKLANRAYELERRGYEIISLNIGNPGAFGFRTPETMRLAMIENLKDSGDEVVVSRSHFMRLWRKDMGHILIPTVYIHKCY